MRVVVSALLFSVLLFLTSLVGASTGDESSVASRMTQQRIAEDWLREEYRRPDSIPFPERAPYSPQAAALGKMLFFDPRISGAQNISCASCHNPSFGWETPVPRALGASSAPLKRHAPTVENLAEARYLTWDGRVNSIEDQVLNPITHPDEMNASMEEVINRLLLIPTYRKAFRAAYPGEGLTSENLIAAIATYTRTLRSGWSPFDDWVAGDDDAISNAAKRGFAFFVGEGGCATCHSGWAFTDHQFHDIGLATDDPGRAAVASGEAAQRRAFKTPGLRNIALRAPYMHNGSVENLVDVLRHYRSGGIETPDRNVDIVPIKIPLMGELELIAFLKTLTAYDAHVSQPSLPVK